MNEHLVKAHKKVSRDVTEADIPRLLEDVKKMAACMGPNALALAHSQIEDKDPLRFFVTKEGMIVCNPVITRHSGYTVDSVEGCITFPGGEPVVVQRWRKVDVSFQLIAVGGKLESKEEHMVGLPAWIFQHEIDHMDGKYIYDAPTP